MPTPLAVVVPFVVVSAALAAPVPTWDRKIAGTGRVQALAPSENTP